MNVDVAVLGGGPGGYTAAIRTAQLGATQPQAQWARRRRVSGLVSFEPNLVTV